MKFSIIGTGNIAWFLGTRLIAAGHHCISVYGHNRDNVIALAEHLAADKYGDQSQISDGDAEVCFLAVSDSAIAEVAVKLSFANTTLIHTAGAMTIDSIANAAADRAVLWPVFSISKNNLPTHRRIPCAWEASSARAAGHVQAMGQAITDELFMAGYQQRKWLHLSAVIGNNFINHLMGICEQVCQENELPFSVLMPILEQTFERLKTNSPRSVQTGPAIRRDAGTIGQQLQLLSGHPHWQKVYAAITDSIQNT